MKDDCRHVLLIINPTAGKKRIRYELYGIIEKLEKAGLVPTVYFTEYKGHAQKIAKGAKAKNFDRIIIAGGDGTLNEVISGCIESGENIPIGIIPAGSTCDFASTLGLSVNMQQAAADIIKGNTKKIDIGKFGKSYFSYVASFGLFTKASYSTNQTAKNLLGRAAYVLEGIKDLGEVHEHRMRITLDDGKVIDDTFLFGAVANSTSIGGFITIDPDDVALDDGEFEYLFVKKPNDIGELLSVLEAVSSYNYECEHLYFGSTKSLHAEYYENLAWSLDGEKAAPEGRYVDIDNLHLAVSVFIPESDEGRQIRLN